MIARFTARRGAKMGKTRKKGTGYFFAGENGCKTRAKTAPRRFPVVLDAIKAACPLFSRFSRLCPLFCLAAAAIVCLPAAHNCHDANYLAFYRVKNFRKLTMKGGAKQ